MRYFLLGFLLMMGAGVAAQSAADYYHSAAELYINGEMESAEQTAESGLAIDPDDAKLRALLERIRQQQERRNEQQGDEGDEGEPSDEQQNPQNEQQSEGESDQQDSEQQDDGQGEQDLPRDDGSTEADGQEEQQADQQNLNSREDEQQEPNRPLSNQDEAEPEDTQPVQLGRMSRAEAERILAALRADESALLRSIRRRPASPRRVERDW